MTWETNKIDDIYEIKDISLGYFINIEHTIIFILFLIFLIFIFKKLLLNNNDEIKNDNEIIKKPIIKKVDFKKMINDFESKYLTENQTIFYSKLIEILREILESKWIKNISKMTFSEISNLKIDNNIKLLIKNIYYKEYSNNILDNEKVRLEYIENIKELI